AGTTRSTSPRPWSALPRKPARTARCGSPTSPTSIAACATACSRCARSRALSSGAEAMQENDFRTGAFGPGDVVLDQTLPGASRAAIALFSQATEDPNPIHVDEEFAKRCGFPQVIQQGPMTTAHFARLLGERCG